MVGKTSGHMLKLFNYFTDQIDVPGAMKSTSCPACRSLMQRMVDCGVKVPMLTEQFRMASQVNLCTIYLCICYYK